LLAVFVNFVADGNNIFLNLFQEMPDFLRETMHWRLGFSAVGQLIKGDQQDDGLASNADEEPFEKFGLGFRKLRPEFTLKPLHIALHGDL
jgi:hypothetical protein